MLKLLRRHKKTNLLLVLLVIGCMYYFSSQDSNASGELSGWFVTFFKYRLSDHFIRKSAHFLEFAALGFLLTTFCGCGKKMLFALPIGLLVAAADEFHQTFSAGRAAMLPDVLLDFSGVLFGFAIVFLCTILAEKKNGSCHDR